MLLGSVIFLGSVVAAIVLQFLSWCNTRPGYCWIDAARMWHGEKKPKWFYDFHQRIVWYQIYTPNEVLTDRGLKLYRRIKPTLAIGILGFAIIMVGQFLDH